MKELCAAMAKAFPEIEGATKDSENPAFKQGGKAIRYADLASVVNAIKPSLVKNALFFTQLTHEQHGGVCVETVVCHESGEQMSFGKLFVPASKNDAQGYGSALTYARRYSLMTAFGVCPEDDDGNAAVATPAPVQQPQPREKLDGPFTTKTALRNAAHNFIRDLEGCGDQDMLTALLTDPYVQALKKQLQRDWPGYLNGDGMEAEYEPINARVRRMQRDLPAGEIN